jgi:hypothetical protein
VAVNNSSNDYGPVYVVRHNFYADMGGSFGGVTYIKASPNMPYFFEQNTFRSDWTGGNSDGDNVLGSLVDAHNNIIYTKAGNIWVSGGTGTITAVTFSGSATGITLGTYNDKKPTSGTNSCVQAFALGTYDQTFDITVGAGPAFTVVAIGFGGYGGCLLNDTLKIPGTVFMGGSTPGNDLTLTVQAVASFTSDNNLYYQTDGTDINNIGKTWDNTGSGGTPAINYSTIAAFRTGTGGDTNTIDGMNPSFVNTANHISSASAAANAGVALDNLNCASASPQTCLWPFTTSNAAIGFWEPNQPVTGGTGADMLLLRVIQ